MESNHPTGIGEVNEEGIDFYNRVIDCCLENGIEPNVTLFHYDLPFTLACKGGWLNNDMAEWFCKYAKICFERFGDRWRAQTWCKSVLRSVAASPDITPS